jgi:hypothetical protein
MVACPWPWLNVPATIVMFPPIEAEFHAIVEHSALFDEVRNRSAAPFILALGRVAARFEAVPVRQSQTTVLAAVDRGRSIPRSRGGYRRGVHETGRSPMNPSHGARTE